MELIEMASKKDQYPSNSEKEVMSNYELFEMARTLDGDYNMVNEYQLYYDKFTLIGYKTSKENTENLVIELQDQIGKVYIHKLLGNKVKICKIITNKDEKSIDEYSVMICATRLNPDSDPYQGIVEYPNYFFEYYRRQ